MYPLNKLFISLVLLSSLAFAQDTIWSPAPPVNVNIPSTILLDYDELRGFKATGRLIDTKKFGSLVIEVREIITEINADGEIEITEPASVVVRYHNRLVAAASGYRLGGELTNNGILLEVWDGIDICKFNIVRLNFAGERLKLTENKTKTLKNCKEK